MEEMIETFDLEITQTKASRLPHIDFNNLPFGRVFTDHMLVAHFEGGKWSKTRIMPYGDIQVSPAASMIHYGQSIFEGLKGFKAPNGDVLIFRPESNWERMNESAERMCMPTVPKDMFIEGMRQLVNIDRNWVPSNPDAALYIRPFLFATDPALGVRPSDNYMFMIICAPVGPYYSKPLHLKIETKYTRAAMGGVGFAKAAGNYGAAMYPARQAQKQGIDQLIWTDAKEHKFLEEAGTMNMMCVINGKLITPPLTSTILPGVTRMSFLELAQEAGYTIEERAISTVELIQAIEAGELQEVFGVGTAATTAQVEKLTFEDKTYELPGPQAREVSTKIGSTLLKIKKGEIEDVHQWNIRF
jgi:branched-chain amino acid aminotransferase